MTNAEEKADRLMLLRYMFLGVALKEMREKHSVAEAQVWTRRFIGTSEVFAQRLLRLAEDVQGNPEVLEQWPPQKVHQLVTELEALDKQQITPDVLR